MRVILETTKNTALPSTGEGYVAPANKVTSTITQVGLWTDGTVENHKYYPETGIGNIFGVNKDFATGNNNGMSYVIRLEDGSFIIVDGGHDTEENADKMFSVLTKQAEGKPIVIAAWIFTHAHSDHAGIFEKFTNKYGTQVTVESFIYNFPSDEAAKVSGDNPNTTKLVQTMSNYSGAKKIVAHAGQVHKIRNATVNIFYTYDMMMPYKMADYNATSVVFNVKLEGSTILFLGDAGGETDGTDGELTYMKKIYTATTLEADIVQAAHHGIDDTAKVDAFYSMISSDVEYVLVPVASRFVKVNDRYYDLEERSALSNLKNAKYYIAANKITVVTLNGGVNVVEYNTVTDYVNS